MMSVSAIFLVVGTFYFQSSCCTSCNIPAWKSLANAERFGFQKLDAINVPSEVTCLTNCDAQSALCVAYSYDQYSETENCVLLGNITFPLDQSSFSSVSNRRVMIKASFGIQFLVFRASKETGHSTYDFYSSEAVSNGPHIWSAHDLSTPLSQPFKHYLLELEPWVIQKVTLVLYSFGAEVVRLGFDSTGATKNTWFEYGRLRDSSWTSLNPDGTSNVLSFTIRSNELRSFWISRYGGHCQDGGWLAVMDGRDYCSWGHFTSFPQFLYPLLGDPLLWGGTETGFADDFLLLADVVL